MRIASVLAMSAAALAAPAVAQDLPAPAGVPRGIRDTRVPEAPRPVGNPGTWFSPEDYPPHALENGIEGDVYFTISVDARGLPSNCRVTTGSGDPELDDVACKTVLERARFEPATDANGQPVKGEWSNRVAWRIPEPQFRLAPGAGKMVLALVIEKDGTVSSCEVEVAEGTWYAEDRLATLQAGMCGSMTRFEPILDETGTPVRRRLRQTFLTEYDPLP